MCIYHAASATRRAPIKKKKKTHVNVYSKALAAHTSGKDNTHMGTTQQCVLMDIYTGLL